MDDAAPASPATPATAATAGTEGSPLKRRLSALLLSEGREREAGGAVEASPLEPGRVERLLSSEFGEDVVRLCEMIAATGAGALCGGGNPPLAPCSSTPPPPRRRLLQGDDNDDDVGEEEHGGESGGRGLPPPSTSREGAGSCASEDGSDDEIGGRQMDAVRRGLLQLQTPPRHRERKESWAAVAADRQPPPQPPQSRQPPPASTQSSPTRRVSVILDSEGGKGAAPATAGALAAAAAAAAAATAPRPPSTLPLGAKVVYQTPPRSSLLSVVASRPTGAAATAATTRAAVDEGHEGQVRLFHHAICRRQEAVAIHTLHRHHPIAGAAALLTTARDAQGRTALMLAACHNLPSLLQLLLTPPATAAAYPPQLGPNAASRKGHHALCYAAMGGHITCLALLLTHAAGGSPHNYQQALQSQSAPCGHSPLHHAVKALHLKAARWLVGRGAGANARIRPSPSLYQAHGARLRTPRQLEEERATALHCAVRVYLRVKEAQQLLKLAGPGAVVAAGGWDGEGEEEEGEAAGCGGGGLVVGLRKGVGGAKCKAGLKEREERAFKLIRWLVEEGRANLLARDARGRTALEMVMTSPLYQRPTLLGSAVSSFSFSSPSSALLSGGGGGSEQPLRDGAGSLESTPTRPARNGGGGRGLGLRPFSLSSAASDPGGAGGSGSGARIKRSLSIASLFSRASSSFRVGRARSRGWSWRSSGKGLGGEEGAEEVTAAAAAVAATPPTAVVPLMGRAISGGGASSLSLTGLAAAAAGGTLASSSGAGAGAATSVRKVAKYLALMQRKQRAVDAAFGELFDVNNLRI